MGAFTIGSGIVGSIGLGLSTGMAIGGNDLFGSSLTMRQRGEMLGSSTLGWIGLGLGMLQPQKYWNYFNKDNSYSIGKGTWLTPGKTGPPYGTDYIKAGNFLSNTHTTNWNDYREVPLRWNQYISGPRIVAPKYIQNTNTFTTGGGVEYRIGGFGSWGEYFKDWRTYFTSQWGE